MIFSWILWLIIIFYLIYKYYTWNYDYWYKRGVPYLPGSAPFGNITDIFFNRKIIGELYKEIYEKFEGSPWCGFFKMRTPILMIREPELIKQVLVKDYYHFEENDFHFNPDADPIMAMNPFTVSGKEWKDTRSILSPAQTPGKIKTVIPCTVTVARNMLDHLNKNHGRTLEMLELFGHYTTDLTASWGLGLEINSFINPNSDIRVNATNMFGGDFRTNMAILLGFYAPTIGNILGWSMMTKGFVNFFNGLVRDVINKRKTSNIKKQDLVEMLLEFQKDSVTKLKRDMDKKIL